MRALVRTHPRRKHAPANSTAHNSRPTAQGDLTRPQGIQPTFYAYVLPMRTARWLRRRVGRGWAAARRGTWGTLAGRPRRGGPPRSPRGKRGGTAARTPLRAAAAPNKSRSRRRRRLIPRCPHRRRRRDTPRRPTRRWTPRSPLGRGAPRAACAGNECGAPQRLPGQGPLPPLLRLLLGGCGAAGFQRGRQRRWAALNLRFRSQRRWAWRPTPSPWSGKSLF